jgi:hypothetical protein
MGATSTLDLSAETVTSQMPQSVLPDAPRLSIEAADRAGSVGASCTVE